MIKWALLVILFSSPLAAAEVNPDSADIFEACETAEEARKSGTDPQGFFDAGKCQGFLLGWAQAKAPGTACEPAMTLYDMTLVFNAYVRRYPAWRVKGAGDAFDAAMEDAFPCAAK